MLDILPTVNRWLAEAQPVALATVVETWGSSPRQAGAKMGISAALGVSGSVSAGCVETAVIEEALQSLKDAHPRLLHYGVSDDTAWDVGLTCGGKMTVYAEPLDATWWRLSTEYAQRDQLCATALILNGELAGQKLFSDGERIVYASAGLSESDQETLWNGVFVPTLGSTRRLTIGAWDVLVDVYQPRPHLIIIGGAHTAMALNQMAHLLGFRVTLIDPRRAFASPERFPTVEAISHEYPDKALAKLTITPQTYLAILTHDPKIDDPAVKFALTTPMRYIGILSSKRTHEKRLERLTAAGIAPEGFARLRVPVGLPIGAKTPEEIALCILAEIVQVKNARP